MQKDMDTMMEIIGKYTKPLNPKPIIIYYKPIFRLYVENLFLKI